MFFHVCFCFCFFFLPIVETCTLNSEEKLPFPFPDLGNFFFLSFKGGRHLLQTCPSILLHVAYQLFLSAMSPSPRSKLSLNVVT